MNYRLIPTPAPLAGVVRFCWQLEGNAASSARQPFHVVADGCPGLLITTQGDLFQAGKKLPPRLLYGQSTQSAQLDLSGQVGVYGICFYPHALKALFRLNAQELTDTCLDVRELPQLRNWQPEDSMLQPGAAPPLDSLFSFLTAQYELRPTGTDPLVEQAVLQLIRSRGNVSLKKMRQMLQISERSLERRFNQWVGISPKLFARICRFQGALHQLRQKQYGKLSDIAFDCGYTDQSHYIRTFREFTGFVPEQYSRALLDTTDSFPTLIA